MRGFTCPCGAGLRLVVTDQGARRFASEYDAVDGGDLSDFVKLECVDPGCPEGFETTLRQAYEWLRVDLVDSGRVPATPNLAIGMADGDPRAAKVIMERGSQAGSQTPDDDPEPGGTPVDA